MDEENKEFKESTDISGYGSFGETGGGANKPAKISFLSAAGKPHFQEKLTNLIIKFSGGLIKNEKQAIYVILALVAVTFIVSFIIFLTVGSNFPNYPEGAEIEPHPQNNINI